MLNNNNKSFLSIFCYLNILKQRDNVVQHIKKKELQNSCFTNFKYVEV